MSAPNDLPTAPSAEGVDDFATLIVAKPATPPTQSMAPSSGANPAAPVPFIFGRRIAQGGMGAILEASDCKLGRTIAVKVMLSEAGCREEQKQRFIQEAAVLGRLEHPNIVPIHDLGLDSEGQLYYTMKLVKGVTLQQILDDLRKEKPEALQHYTLDRLLTIFRKVCDALAFAHAQNIIHRDLKPENIMVGEFGEVLVMDWGIAKILDGSADIPVRSVPDPISGQESLRSSTASPTATVDGAVMGTPNYMSPEQAMGRVNEMDARSDIFSLGGILYCILTLRPPVEGKDVWEVLERVSIANITAPTTFGVTTGTGKASAKGDVLEAKKITPLPHMAGGRVPNALSAVSMKALTLDKTKRYRDIAAFIADIEKYQGGFATSAENAGAWKQFTLLIKRNKAASIGVAAVLIVGATLGTKAIIEGKRAEREAIRAQNGEVLAKSEAARAERGEAKANAALADLKASAPALLQLAESEADSQRFPSALGKLDAALDLDPALLRARWQRAWVLLALERWSEAADALRLARQHDPADAKLASILPVVEQVAAAPEAGRWQSDATREVFAHLQTVEATGPSLAFSGKLKLGAQERRKLADQRLGAMLGKGNYAVTVESDGLVKVELHSKAIRSFEALRGLTVDYVWAQGTEVESLEPLRGMPLHHLSLTGARSVHDLSPLAGMPLCDLDIHQTKVIDLAPLAGMQLTYLSVAASEVSRIDVLRGMPLVFLEAGSSRVTDLSPLKGAPLQILHINNTRVTDLAVLQGAPLKELVITRCQQLKDFSPVLKFSHLERLNCDVLPDSLLPLRESKTLQIIDADAWTGENHTGPRPVAEFWKAYDAHQAAAKK